MSNGNPSIATNVECHYPSFQNDNTAPLNDNPSLQLVQKLKSLVEKITKPDLPMEIQQELLSEALTYFLQEPNLHWWCNPDLRPIAIELLHIFSLNENATLVQFKVHMEHILGICLDCTESYLQDRRIYLERLLKLYKKDVVDTFFNLLLNWDCSRLENRIQTLLMIESSPSTQKRKKIVICELLLEPSLLILPDYSSKLPELFSQLLSQMLQIKKIKVMSVLPGLWLLTLHQDIIIQSWAVFTTNIAASEDSLVPERWLGWEQFPTIWNIVMCMSKGSRQAQAMTKIPLTNDPARMWRAIRAMLSSMSRDVIKLSLLSDINTWKTFRSQLLELIQNFDTPPVVFLEACRIVFYLLDNLKQEFWIIDNINYLTSLDDIKKILMPIFVHPGTMEYISALMDKEQANRTTPSSNAISRVAVEYSTWISNFINSMSGNYELPKTIVSSARTILEAVCEHIIPIVITSPGASTMNHGRNSNYLEFNLELLNIALQLLVEHQNDSVLDLTAAVISEHWKWLAPICALGPQAVDLSKFETETIKRLEDLLVRTSITGVKTVELLLDRESVAMWRNYSTATSTAKLEQRSMLVTNSTIWLQLTQATSDLGSSNIRDRLGQHGQERLMEWQTTIVEHLSKLTLLPKVETKPHFRPDVISMSESFNKELEILFRANSILLQSLISQGELWLKKMLNNNNKRFLVKILKFWSSSDPETRTQALFIMRSAWQEVTRPACLRLAYQIGGEQSIEELNNILEDFRSHGSPGGATPPALFELLLDSVTTLFLNNPIDGEGGLYLQIFLDLVSSQDIARHISLIKTLWNSIWLSLKAAFFAGRTIWADRQDRGETIKTMKIVANVGLLIIGKIRYFERLLEFEKQGLDGEIQDQDLMDGLEVLQADVSSDKETMPLEAMNDGLDRIADWTYAQDSTLCTSAIELVCAVLNLLADHNNFINENVNNYLTKIAEGSPKIKSLLTTSQREVLWFCLSRHDASQDGSIPPSKFRSYANINEEKSEQVPIEISDDDFADIDDIDLTDFDYDDNVTAKAEESLSAPLKNQTSISSALTPHPLLHRTPHVPTINPFQSKLNFTSSSSSTGIPAGGSTTRRLPLSLNRLSLNTSSKVASKPTSKPSPKPISVKKGHKLSQMRADHRKERSNIIQATKDARQLSRAPVARSNNTPQKLSDSESDTDSELGDDPSGLGSLVDTELKWNNRNKPQEPRKTKLLELSEVVGPNKFMDAVAIRRQKALEDAQRQHRLMPNLSALHAQILKWEVSATGDRPPGDKEYATIPSTFESVNDYVKAFEPLLVLECWQQLMGAREEVNQSSDSVIASFVNRVSIDDFQDTHMKMPLDKASSLMVEDIVVISDPNVKDVFTATGNLKRPKPFFAKVQSITKAKGVCEVVFRTCLKIEETSPLMFMRPLTSWSILKMLNLTTTHREYAALAGIRYFELCSDILNPPDDVIRKPSLSNVQKIMDTFKVNTPQAHAIVGAIDRPKGFTLIQGPPGTGKTKTILGLVGALSADNSRPKSAPVVHSSRATDQPLQTGTANRILICAPSNAAIDEIVKRLMGGIRNMSGEISIPKVVRVGTLETVNMEVKDVALDTLIAKELESVSTSKEEFHSAAQSMTSMREKMRQLQQELEKARLELVQAKDTNDSVAISNAQSKIKSINKSKWQLGQDLDTARSNQADATQKRDQARKNARNKILGEADVICATLSASGHDLLTSSSFSFETVIIDEAAQSVEISSLIPLKFGCKRCILVGDPNQLPPTVISQLATKYAYNQSLFVRLQSLTPHSVHLLSIQYRMHPDISAFPSREFYKSLLKDGPGMAEKTRAEWHSNSIMTPYRFFDVYQGQEKIGLSHSQHNPIEAEAAAALLEGLCNGNPKLNFFRRVGVISPYKQQVRTLKEYFQRVFGKEILEAVDFNTVDGFQGQEKDIIIFSCVRASSYGSVGFLADIRRMNVALTRARQSLFILGHAETLRRERIWGDLVVDAEARNMFTRVTSDVFGRRGATAPNNILRPKSTTADRRNDLYGKASDHKHATAIERPMSTIDEIMEVAFYPILPESPMESNTKAIPSNARNTNQHGHERQRLEIDTKRGEIIKSVDTTPDSRLTNGKRKQEDSSLGFTLSDIKQSPVEGKYPLPSPGVRLPPPAARPPSPKRTKTAPSLFLKSKPMSMKPSGPSRQYDVPTRERLAAQVIPIRKSYPSGQSRVSQPAAHAKRSSGPSIDDILGSMNKKS
ncbi:DEAD-box type RNA helicase [Entomortierella beljakovae]|nr:DEAD-box type RNA helicase [Entomortierella beljakovae]